MHSTILVVVLLELAHQTLLRYVPLNASQTALKHYKTCLHKLTFDTDEHANHDAHTRFRLDLALYTRNIAQNRI